MNVRDCMTQSPITVPGETTVGGALALLAPLEIRHLPVTEPGGRLIGIISERDLHSFYASREELAGDWAVAARAKLEEPVSKIMASPAISVEAGAPITEAIQRILDNRVSALPVVEGGKLVGIVSYVDLLRVLAAKLASG